MESQMNKATNGNSAQFDTCQNDFDHPVIISRHAKTLATIREASRKQFVALPQSDIVTNRAFQAFGTGSVFPSYFNSDLESILKSHLLRQYAALTKKTSSHSYVRLVNNDFLYVPPISKASRRKKFC